jgi:hypothetical protein
LATVARWRKNRLENIFTMFRIKTTELFVVFFVAKNRVYVSCFEVEGKKVAIKSFFFYGAFAKWPIFLHFEKFGNSEVGT